MNPFNRVRAGQMIRAMIRTRVVRRRQGVGGGVDALKGFLTDPPRRTPPAAHGSFPSLFLALPLPFAFSDRPRALRRSDNHRRGRTPEPTVLRYFPLTIRPRRVFLPTQRRRSYRYTKYILNIFFIYISHVSITKSRLV